MLFSMTAAAVLAGGVETQRVVIAGAGLQGASLAYHLTQRGVKPLVIEADRVAGAASGKGGGFLARDWVSRRRAPLTPASRRAHGSTRSVPCVRSGLGPDGAAAQARL